MHRNPARRFTRSTALCPTCQQTFSINNVGNINPPNTVLTIPYETIFDTHFPGYPSQLPGQLPYLLAPPLYFLNLLSRASNPAAQAPLQPLHAANSVAKPANPPPPSKLIL